MIGLLLQGLLLSSQLKETKARVIESASQDTRVVAMLAAAELTHQLRHGATAMSQEELTHLVAHPEIQSATLLNERGEILQSTNVFLENPANQLADEARRLLTRSRNDQAEVTLSRDGKLLFGTAPVNLPKAASFAGYEPGALLLERDLSARLKAARLQAIRHSLIQGAGVLAAVIVLYWSLRTLLLLRLERARATARRIADGDHEARARLPGSDEIATLGADLDLMARRLSERQALERAFQESQKLESLGQLTGGVAHDFNNLLAAVNLSAGVLRTSLPKDHPDQEMVDDIEVVCHRGSELTRQLLQFARQDTSAKKPFDLAASLSDLTNILDRLLPDNIQLHVRNLLDSAWIDGNRSNIEQCLINLVVNARDAMPEGGRIGLELRRALRAEEPFAVLEVNDNGHGIPPELQERIFEPFFTTKEPGKGTGLGLASIFGIVKQHQGELYVDSTVGAGSTFTLWFPLYVGSVTSSPPDAHRLPLRRSAKILLVEDDAAVRRGLVRSLQDRGFEVHDASEGQAALRALVEQPSGTFDVVVSDLGLPDMTGLQLRERLKENGRDVPFLLISGYADERGARSQLESLAVPLLEKPFTPEELVSKLLTLLPPEEQSAPSKNPATP